MTSTNTGTTYTAQAITLATGLSCPVQYAQDNETGAMLLIIETAPGKTAEVILHCHHADHAAALAAMQESDSAGFAGWMQDAAEEAPEAQESEVIPTFAEARAAFEAANAAEIAAKKEARETLIAAKQARKEAKPLPERAGESIQGNGFVIKFDAFYRDTMVVFEAVPLPEVRQAVKDGGFYWSPNKGAWVRGLDAKGKRKAEALAVVLANMKAIYPRKRGA